MNPQLQAMLQQAIQAFEGGNFDGAEVLLKRILQVDSKNLPALHVLGLIKASQSNYKEAADYLARAARIHPNDASIQYNLAKALSDSGNDKDALAHHKKAVTLAPNNPEAWLSYGKSASNLGRYEDALVWYGNALNLKPDYAEAALNKGATLKELKRYEEAIACAEHALTINPNLSAAWSNKGVALKELKRYDEAIACYDQAISLKPDYAEGWSNKGMTLYELKRYDEAIACYDQALSLKPDYAEGWSNKGNILYELKRYDEAIVYYDKALSLKPGYAEGWSNKGATLHELKRYDEAITHYDQAIGLKPNYAEAWSNKGNVLNELRRYDEAIIHHDKATSLKPDYAEGWSNKGNTLYELKRYDEAIAHHDQALSLKPDYAETWSNKGNSLHKLKRYDEAIACYDQALSLKPDYAEGWSNKGNILYELKRYDEAIVYYDKALSLKPGYAEGWSNKGATLHELKRYDEAITHYDQAIGLKPNYAEAWSNKGNVLNELRRYDEAIIHHDKATSLKPDYAEGWSNKGNTLYELKRYDEAIACYDKALSLKPNLDWILGNLVYAKMQICNWPTLSNDCEHIAQKVMAEEKIVTPFMFLAMNDNDFLHKKCSEIYAQNRYPLNLILGPISKYAKKERIRIAYFSPDFRNHPVSFLTSELFEIHDRDRFEVIAFSLHKAPVGDQTNLRLRKVFDRFIDIDNMLDQEIAQLARELEIDIAIDLAGPTQYSRTGIFSYRAAPIQVNWLGYPGTIGTNYIDYIVADKTIIPAQSQKFYSEKVISLPDTYMVDDSKRIPSTRVFTKQECGLPENTFIFCCFNNDYKFNPQVLDSWSMILLAVENSILWISANNERFRVNITTEFERRGVDPARIIFAQREELMADHLARYTLADLFLDTHPYNAHTTSVDALKAGLPVLTLKGQSFASRVAASLLNAIGLPDLITNTQKEYEALAIELAMNHQKLADLKLKLANNRLTAPLFNTPLFTKNLEAAYIKMYERYQADLEPEHISIT